MSAVKLADSGSEDITTDRAQVALIQGLMERLVLSASNGIGSVVGLDGEMGSGKTSFVRRVAELVGADPSSVASPTFALSNWYYLGSPKSPLAASQEDWLTRLRQHCDRVGHWDLFRLKSAEELDATGFWDELAKGRQIVFIEWSNRLKEWNLRDDFIPYRLGFAADKGGRYTLTWQIRPPLTPSSDGRTVR